MFNIIIEVNTFTELKHISERVGYMFVFSNQVLHPENIDFSKWATINGELIELETARSEYLERCLQILNYYMNRYVAHVNYPVWEQYADVVEDILVKRG